MQTKKCPAVHPARALSRNARHPTMTINRVAYSRCLSDAGDHTVQAPSPRPPRPLIPAKHVLQMQFAAIRRQDMLADVIRFRSIEMAICTDRILVHLTASRLPSPPPLFVHPSRHPHPPLPHRSQINISTQCPWTISGGHFVSARSDKSNESCKR
jgi:hypothetical protein